MGDSGRKDRRIRCTLHCMRIGLKFRGGIKLMKDKGDQSGKGLALVKSARLLFELDF